MQTDTRGSLRDKFGDFGAAPSEGLWNSIAASLDEDQKRRGAFWWWMLGSAAVIAVIFSVYQIGYKAGANDSDMQSGADAENEIHPATPGETYPLGNKTDELITNLDGTDQSSVSLPENNLNKITDASQQNQLTEENERDDHENNPDQAAINNQAKTKKETGVDPGLNEDVNWDGVLSETDIPPLDYSFPGFPAFSKLPDNEIVRLTGTKETTMNLAQTPIEKKHPAGFWEIGFNATTLGSLSPGYDLNAETFDTGTDTNNSVTGDTLPDAAFYSPGSAYLRRPFSAEVTLGRSLGPRVNFQTGLGIGLPRYDGYYTTGDITYENIRFVALHIPVHFTFDFINRRRFEAYTGLGINNEFPVHRKAYSVAFQLVPNTFEAVESKKFGFGYQGSVQFSLGLRYRLNEKIRIDFRPNARYYYSEKKSAIPAGSAKIWAGITAGITLAL
jgi:hypothetical protein